jgi:hypothetical protein
MPRVGDYVWHNDDRNGCTAILIESMEGQDPAKPGRGSVTGKVIKSNGANPYEAGTELKVGNHTIRSVQHPELFNYNRGLLKAIHSGSFHEILAAVMDLTPPDVDVPSNITEQVEVLAARPHSIGSSVIYKANGKYGLLLIRNGVEGDGLVGLATSSDLFWALFANEFLASLAQKWGGTNSQMRIEDFKVDPRYLISPEE